MISSKCKASKRKRIRTCIKIFCVTQNNVHTMARKQLQIGSTNRATQMKTNKRNVKLHEEVKETQEHTDIASVKYELAATNRMNKVTLLGLLLLSTGCSSNRGT
jgi:hypothetical protein